MDSRHYSLTDYINANAKAAGHTEPGEFKYGLAQVLQIRIIFLQLAGVTQSNAFFFKYS